MLANWFLRILQQVVFPNDRRFLEDLTWSKTLVTTLINTCTQVTVLQILHLKVHLGLAFLWLSIHFRESGCAQLVIVTVIELKACSDLLFLWCHYTRSWELIRTVSCFSFNYRIIFDQLAGKTIPAERFFAISINIKLPTCAKWVFKRLKNFALSLSKPSIQSFLFRSLSV